MEAIQFKKSIFSNYLPLLTSILFIFLLLTNPVTSSNLVLSGLITWCSKMIPSLFPFMVLSGILLRTGLSFHLSKLLYPLLGTLFCLSPDCIYVIFMGFLCGFPMGANIIAESLSLNKISKREASLLLAFCNNIGPVYFISFASVLCPYYPIWISLSIMYLVPLSYGLTLRYTRYCDIPIYKSIRHKNKKERKKHQNNFTLHNTDNVLKTPPAASFGNALQESLQKAITSILSLGGYMVIFTVLQLPFYNSYYQLSAPYIHVLKGLLEISSGITAIQPYPELYAIVYALLLPFCGLCCLYQTYAMIQNTPLSLLAYFKHKLAQTFCTLFIYGVIICCS